MDILSSEDLLKTIDNFIDFLTSNEDRFYVALEVAYQLRDEVIQALPRDEDE